MTKNVARLEASSVHPPVGTLIDGGKLELVEVLGVGGYGVVYHAVDVVSSYAKSYAVKCLLQRQDAHRQNHLRELALHQLASMHPNVVTLHRIVEDDEYAYIIMDYAPDHDLFYQILNNCRYLGDSDLIRHIFLQILDAVEFCHSMGIYHRDLKPENILCFDDGLRVAITDFGLATTDKLSNEYRTGSVYHMSPECQGGQFARPGGYSPKANDIWSLGIILLNLMTGRNPWRIASASDPTFQAYLRDPYNFIPCVLPVSTQVNDLLVHMLDVDWTTRMTLPELREAIMNVDNFYCDGVIFDGSMAKCSWEATTEVPTATSSTEAESSTSSESNSVDFAPQTKFQSYWSKESSVVAFGRRSVIDENALAEAMSWTTLSDHRHRWSSMYSMSSDRTSTAYRSRTISASSAEGVTSMPSTPPDTTGTLGDRARNPRLTINTDLSSSYYDADVSMSSFTATSEDVYAAAYDSPSSFYLASAVTCVDHGKGKADFTSPLSFEDDVFFPEPAPSTAAATEDNSSLVGRTTTPAPDTIVWPEEAAKERQRSGRTFFSKIFYRTASQSRSRSRVPSTVRPPVSPLAVGPLPPLPRQEAVHPAPPVVTLVNGTDFHCRETTRRHSRRNWFSPARIFPI